MKVGKPSNTFGLSIFSTADGTRPTSASFGTSVTPVQNAYGSYAQLISGANLTDDCYELVICVNNVGISTVSRDCVVSIGLDPAGGTSYTSLVDLVVGPASNMGAVVGSGGVWFKFPIFIAAGTSIGAAGAVSSTDVTSFGVCCVARCRPSHPENIIIGKFIDQYGVTLASSSGTAITEGTTSEGAYVALSSALTRPIVHLSFGRGHANGTMSSGLNVIDIAIGDASNKLVIISNAPVLTSSSEFQTKMPSGEPCDGAIGVIVYGRAQTSTNAPSGVSLAAYGVGV